MASVDRVGDKWRARWREPGGRQRQRGGFASKAEAKLYADTRTVDMHTGTYVPPEKQAVLLCDYAPIWLASKRQVSAGTRDLYRLNITHNLLPHLGAVPVHNLTHAHVDDLIEILSGKGLATATVKKIVNVLSQICERAMRDRILTVNPCRKPDLPASNPREMLYLTPAELDRLCAQMRPQAALLTRFLAYTGLRWGEATALTVADVDLLHGRVRVDKSMSRKGEVGPTKTRTTRWVPLEPDLARQLNDYASGREGLVFASPTGKPVHSSNFRRDHFTPAKKAASIDSALRIHDLRHTCATWLINEGYDVWRISRWLGHSNIVTTTTVYAHLLPHKLDDMAEGLGRIRTRAGDGPATVAKVVAL